MTTTDNFFQSLKMIGLFSSPKLNSSERQLSSELIKDGKKCAEQAQIEAENADEARKLTLSAKEDGLKKNLARIAVWHYEISAKFYRQAAARYTEASRIRTDQEKVLQTHSKKILELARNAKSTAKLLQSL